MEVTNENFKQVLKLLPTELKDAEFIAIDTEFTGLQLEGQDLPCRFDTVETLYRLDKKRVESFIVIQYGIAAFYYDKQQNRYSCRWYSFYVYPSDLVNNCNFICQARSLRFLAENEFDFNKLLNHGIPYLREDESKRLIERNEELERRELKAAEWSGGGVADDRKASGPEVESIVNEITEILSKDVAQEVKIPKYNSGLRKLIHSELLKRFKHRVFLTEHEDETMTALVGLREYGYTEKVKSKYRIKKEKILDSTGFSNVIKLLVKLGKLIVGHNFLLDLMYTIHQFIQPLPDSWDEFVELVHFLFPKVLDTKVLASPKYFKEIKDTNLYAVQEFFEKSCKISVDFKWQSHASYGRNEGKQHNAAYDAYLSGLCYIAAKSLLGPGVAETSENKATIRKLMNVDQHVSLCAPTPRPDRSCVFHLTFPKEWTSDDILKLFKMVGIPDICWTSDVSAYLYFKRHQLPAVKQFLTHTDKEYKLRTFYEDNPSKEESTDTAQKRLKIEEDTGEVVQRVPTK